jgi:hypothetical protein
LNELTQDDLNDYYLQQLNGDTLTLVDIIKRLEKREIATKNVNGEAFVDLVFDEIANATLEGHNVVTRLFHTSLGFNGVVHAQELGHNIPAEQVHVRMLLAQSVEVRELVKASTVHVGEQPAPTGPVIQAVTNPVSGEMDSLNTGAMVLVRGLRMAVRGEKIDEIGVYFNAFDNPAVEVRVPAEQISPNSPSKLQFVLPPNVYAGQWKVTVRTQASSNKSQFVKEVRAYEYPNVITVI